MPNPDVYQLNLLLHTNHVSSFAGIHGQLLRKDELTACVQVISARLREPNQIPVLYHDPEFRHRKVHFLLRRAGCAAFCIDPSNVAMRTQFGFASRRDALPYLVFRGIECAYGPPELKHVEEIVCSGLKMPVSLEVAAGAERIMPLQAPLLAFLNNEMHKTLVYKERTLSDGVYLTKIDVKHVSDETALLEFMSRRTEDRSLLPVLVKRFLQAKLGHASLSVRFSRDARRELGEQIADALKLHYGSWLLFAPGFGELAAGGRELRMKMAVLNLRNARHPKLCEMYLKPTAGVEEWRPCVKVSRRAQIWD